MRDDAMAANAQLDDGGVWPVLPSHELAPLDVFRPAIGLVQLSIEVVMENELRAFLPDNNCSIHSSRISFPDNPKVSGLSYMEDHITAGAEVLPDREWLDVIAYGCTSGSMVIGPDRVAELINRARPDVPVINPISSSVTALSALNARRIAVVTPYPQEVNGVVAAFFHDSGFDIAGAVTFDLDSGYAMSRLRPKDLYAAAIEADTDGAEAVFISCTTLVVSPILADLERALGKPVVSSNQAIAWQSCQIADIQAPSQLGGSLFDHRLAA